MTKLIIMIEFISPNAITPSFAHAGDHGADLFSAEENDIELLPGDTKAITTGLKIDVPEGNELQIRSKSGLALKGIVVANSPGTIDARYRGEVKVILHNQGREPFIVKRQTKIAQAVVAPVISPVYIKVDQLNELPVIATKDRGVYGFGSSGLHGNEERIPIAKFTPGPSGTQFIKVVDLPGGKLVE